MNYTVRQLAKIAGVSIRTIHYYDEIGLLKPAFVKENGYRGYGEAELLKLEQILFFKELEFSLEEIVQIMNASDFDTLTALTDQKKYLELKEAKLKRQIITINKAINTLKGGEKIMQTSTTTIQDKMEEYKKEAKARWGNTDAYKQSQKRTANWTKADYDRVAADTQSLTKELAVTMDKGFDSPEFQALVERHHQAIEVFYDCSPEMYRGLASMYVTDPRFRAFYDKFRPGLAELLHKAINYYCDQKEK